MRARLTAIRLIGDVGPAAKDARQTLYNTWKRNTNTVLGAAANDAMKRITPK